MPPEADTVRLRHMLDATREALAYVEGKTRNDLEGNTMLLRALVKCIEIVGEAASRVGEDTRRTIPSIPWDEIRAMRNHLIHAYFDVNRDIVWQTVVEDLPLLESHLARVLDDTEG